MGIGALGNGLGYRLVTAGGRVYDYGAAVWKGNPNWEDWPGATRSRPEALASQLGLSGTELDGFNLGMSVRRTDDLHGLVGDDPGH